jgi:predicted dehydrogenase
VTGTGRTGRPMRLAVVGAGGRGRDAYGRWAVAHPDRAQVVAVADPDPVRRDSLATVSGAAAYAGWQALLDDAATHRLDGVVIATPDVDHVDVALAVADLGLPFLLEKPAAPTMSELERLAVHVHESSARLAICHVLRFTPFWRSVHQVVSSGVLGPMQTIEVRENIGFWHFAHSYVRGNWRSTAQSSPMVLAKTSHDLDLIRWLVGSAPRSVYSIGELGWFRPENAPAGAPERCLDGCPAADTCPFYAPRYYVDALKDLVGHPVHLLGSDTSPEGRLAALRTGAYGRCVFRSDNDVVDHQQTTMSFPGGVTATLTASAFTAENTRNVSISAPFGQLNGHMESGEIVVDLFSPGAELPAGLPIVEHATERKGPMGHVRHRFTVASEADLGDHAGHAGGDAGLMSAFVDALADDTVGEGELSFSTALDAHLMAFAAEESRLTAGPVDFADFTARHHLASRSA